MTWPEVDRPATVVLDDAAGITAKVSLGGLPGGGTWVMVAIHDRGRPDPGGDDEVYALALRPDRAWDLGATLNRCAARARDAGLGTA